MNKSKTGTQGRRMENCLGIPYSMNHTSGKLNSKGNMGVIGAQSLWSVSQNTTQTLIQSWACAYHRAWYIVGAQLIIVGWTNEWIRSTGSHEFLARVKYEISLTSWILYFSFLEGLLCCVPRLKSISWL